MPTHFCHCYMSYHPSIHSSPRPYPKPTPRQRTRFTNIIDNCKYQSPLPNEFCLSSLQLQVFALEEHHLILFVFIAIANVRVGGQGYSQWRLEVLVLEVVGVGSYKCSHCRLQVLEAPSACIGRYTFIVGGCKCWRLHVLGLEARNVCIGGNICLHQRLQVLEATSVRVEE